MLILSPLDPISSVVSASHTVGLRGGSDSDLSRRITILDAITQGRGGVEPRTITFVCSVSYRESRARERSCGEGKKHYPRRLQHFGFYLAEAASLDLLDSGGHGDDVVFAFFLVEILHLQQHLVFLDAELGAFSHWEKHRMLIVPRADAIDHVLALQQVFLAEQFAAFLVPGIGAEHFAGKALTVFFVNATCHRVHLQQRACLIVFRLLGVAQGSKQNRGY